MAKINLTFEESIRLALIACRIEDEPLRAACLRLARGDETALPEIHDRMNALGNFAAADTVLRLVAD